MHTDVRSHVERCLADMLGVCRVPADQDGDYIFRSGSAACYVRVEDQDPVIVRVFAIATTGVSRSAKLLVEINQVNSRSRSAWVTWAAGQVVVSQALTAESVTAQALDQACGAVVRVANDVGGMIAAVLAEPRRSRPAARTRRRSTARNKERNLAGGRNDCAPRPP